MKILKASLLLGLLLQGSLGFGHDPHEHDVKVKIIVENPSEASELLAHIKKGFHVQVDSIETQDTIPRLDTHTHSHSHSHSSIDTLKDTIKDLYEDSTELWNRWKLIAGDKWDHTKNALKDSEDETMGKAYETFFGVMNDLKSYHETLHRSGDRMTAETQKGLMDVLEKLKSTYAGFKEETKVRIEGATSKVEEKAHEGAHAVSDTYEDATGRFLRIKEVLKEKMEHLKDRISDKGHHVADKLHVVSYESLKDKAKDLLDKVTDTWNDFKTKIGDKLEKHNLALHKKMHSAHDNVVDDINKLHLFLKSDYIKLNDEARHLLNYFLDELIDQYGHLKFQTELIASDVSKGAQKVNMKSVRAYENTLSKYAAVRGKIQSEVDYITGKISKFEYESAHKMKDKYEKLISESKSFLEKVEDVVKHPIDSTAEALRPAILKVRELFADAVDTFVELDAKLAPYWDDITGQLKKVKDNTSKRVRDTFHHAADDFRTIERKMSHILHNFKGKIDSSLYKTFHSFEEKFHKLKDLTRQKYEHWIKGETGDKALDLAYDQASKDYEDTKKLLLVEIHKYFIVEVDPKNNSEF